MINESEADWFHLDVMDGRFVPNISFGPMIIEFIRKTTSKVCDVHLMILEPEKYVEDFRKAGADMLTVHLECCTHLHRNIEQIKSLGMQAGVALNPHSPVEMLKEVLDDLDMVLIMSVNPGFGGQKFIPNTLNKIRTLRRPDIFQDHDKPELQYAEAGLDADGIVRGALSALGLDNVAARGRRA